MCILFCILCAGNQTNLISDWSYGSKNFMTIVHWFSCILTVMLCSIMYGTCTYIMSVMCMCSYHRCWTVNVTDQWICFLIPVYGITVTLSDAELVFFTARHSVSIASAVLATAIPSVCLSVRPSITRRYCVKTMACSTVQFALSDSKMCLVL